MLPCSNHSPVVVLPRSAMCGVMRRAVRVTEREEPCARTVHTSYVLTESPQVAVYVDD